MRKKEYEQRLIQDLARENEELYKKSLNQKKYNAPIIRGEQHMLNMVITSLMGFTMDARGDGAITFLSLYKKDGKIRHKRNIIKRK